MNETEIDFCIAALARNLEGCCLDINIAIYRHSDGHLSSSAYAGSNPPYAADGSDEVIWLWESGDYDRSGGHHASARWRPKMRKS